jgi:glutamine amidotransferase
MEKLKASGIDEFIDIIKNDRIPMLGICVGMQVMGSIGTEFGFSKGLSLIDGKVSGMREIGLHDCNRLPNIGWRNVELADKSYSWIFDNITDENRFYFFHSYAFDGATPNVVANAQYGNISYPAVIASENMIGVQFHPEKSGKNGLQFLDNFLNWET